MVEFNEDGSIKWGEDLVQRKREEPYIQVLRAINEIPFGVGRKLLTAVLQGDDSNASIRRNKLQNLIVFGSLAYDDQEISEVIQILECDGFIAYKSYANKPWKVLSLTNKGSKELDNPSFYRKKEAKQTFSLAEISESDMELFKQFDFYLNRFNLEQKKAITSTKDKILCVAGAGSGKTTVLTTRIDFLLKFRSVSPNKILAITFTRKARVEMMERLAELGHKDVKVETFNSFSEKILKKYNDIIYGKRVRMMSYGDKIRFFREALASLSISPKGAVENYFKKQQLKTKTPDQLFNIFMNDCFFIVDYYKSKGKEVEDFSKEADNVLNAKMVYTLCKYIEARMRNEGLRTHMDQIVDTINFFKTYKSYIPQFEHILVDEYQDVNDLQIELIALLKAPNLFCVGDPRQSIFGWRGSNIKYILDFQKQYEDSEVVSLRKNYRSSKVIVNFMNEAIRPMALPKLDSDKNGGKKVKLINFKNEDVEFEFVLQSILASSVARKDIFVLARTNRQLTNLSRLFNERGISHITKGDDTKMVEASEGQVTLATVHAIKGLEAEMVFVIGCTMNNFPCKGSEHPVVDLIKIDEYDKEEEERRLFYVALSRAREQLYLTYSGRRHSYYITEAMKKQMGMGEKSWYQDRSLKEFA